MKVKKPNGISSNKPITGTWLAHWEKCSNQKAYMCYGQGCINTPSVGALIQLDSATDTNWYVIPLCDDCNKKKGQELEIWDTATLITANAIETKVVTAVTPRNFAQWASEQFPAASVFGQSRLRNG